MTITPGAVSRIRAFSGSVPGGSDWAFIDDDPVFPESRRQRYFTMVAFLM
jgi:hypothetical protein